MHRLRYVDHNWLAYKINNVLVHRHLKYVRGTVIDLGIGIGPYREEITAVSDMYIGLDWAQSIHELDADVIANLNRGLPFAEAVADTVVSFQVLEHLCEPQVMLNEAFRILRPGGRILLSVPFQWWVHESPHDYFRFTRFGLQHLFAKAGFTNIAIAEVSGFWVTWFLKLNYQSTRLIRGPLPVRWLAKAILVPLWMLDQALAPILDRHWKCPEETQGYFVSASKP